MITLDPYSYPSAMRVELVPIELRAPRVPRPVCIVAGTAALVQFTVRADGALAPLESVKLTLAISDSAGHAKLYEGFYISKGCVGFAIGSQDLTEPCELVWQLIAVPRIPDAEGQEWGRGSFRVLDNPSADYSPITWPEPPFIGKDRLGEYITVDTESMTMETLPDGRVKLASLAKGGGGAGVPPETAKALKAALEKARSIGDIRIALIDFANALIPTAPEA